MGKLAEQNFNHAKQLVLRLFTDDELYTLEDVFAFVDHAHGENTIRKVLATLQRENLIHQKRNANNKFAFQRVPRS